MWLKVTNLDLKQKLCLLVAPIHPRFQRNDGKYFIKCPYMSLNVYPEFYEIGPKVPSLISKHMWVQLTAENVIQDFGYFLLADGLTRKNINCALPNM